MIVRGTKQLGSFKRGINLYIPNKRLSNIVLDGLLLHLDANNLSSYSGSGATWYDLSSPSNDMSLIDTPTFNSSSPKHFSFNGSSEYATGSGNVVPQTAYTKCVWFKLAAYVDNNLVSSSTGGHFMFFASDASHKLFCGHSNWTGAGNPYLSYPSNTVFDLDTWYFAVLTFNTTDGMTLYINGVLDSVYTARKTAHSGTGATNLATFGGSNLLNGSISIVMTYDRAISASEALANYNATKSIFGY